MIPILSTEQVRLSDQYTIENEPIASIDLMERACASFTAWFTTSFPTDLTVSIVCGPGNNGGDGLGVARLLIEAGYEVQVHTFPASKYSEDYQVNLERLSKSPETNELQPGDQPEFKTDIIVDAIFGSGLTREAGGLYAEVINHVNEFEGLVISIDIPSGLKSEGKPSGPIIQADYTISFQYPKMNLLLPESAEYVGEWDIVDIGLSEEVLESFEVKEYLTDFFDIQSVWPLRNKYDHKSSFGHILIAGGSHGKMGAVIMAGRAALRTGSGLLTAYIPECGYDILQTALPEAMTKTSGERDIRSISSLEKISTVGCGPGMGVTEDSLNFLRELLSLSPQNLVIDADGLNLLSENRELLSSLPQNTILTPHPGEFRRLVGEWNDDFAKIALLREFCKKYKIIVVLKGAHSVICDPSGYLYFNSTGNPGMATAGSGDVLTGIITSLVGQWDSPLIAALAGVYLHGLSGDMGAIELGEDSLMATDIIDYIPDAILEITGQ